jgi:hypothetical protein
MTGNIQLFYRMRDLATRFVVLTLLFTVVSGCSDTTFGGSSSSAPPKAAAETPSPPPSNQSKDPPDRESPSPQSPQQPVVSSKDPPSPNIQIDAATANAVIVSTATATGAGANPAEEAMFSGLLSASGAQSGAIQISLVWSGVIDLDLHAIDPSGAHIYYDHRHDSAGGSLDVDANGGDQAETSTPIENIFWAQPPHGTYKIYVNFYGQNESDATSAKFQVRQKIGDQISYFPGTVQYTGNDFDASGGDAGTVLVNTFQY